MQILGVISIMKSIEQANTILQKLLAETKKTRRTLTMVNLVNILTIIVLIVFMVTK